MKKRGKVEEARRHYFWRFIFLLVIAYVVVMMVAAVLHGCYAMPDRIPIYDRYSGPSPIYDRYSGSSSATIPTTPAYHITQGAHGQEDRMFGLIGCKLDHYDEYDQPVFQCTCGVDVDCWLGMEEGVSRGSRGCAAGADCIWR